MDRIALTGFPTFAIPLPPIAEQRAIAAILAAFDEKIDLNRRTNETLETIARAIFKDWFVDFGPTRAKMEGQAPYFAPELWALFPERLDDEGKPDGWLRGALGGIADILMGASPDGTTYNDVGIGTPPCERAGRVWRLLLATREVDNRTGQALAGRRSDYLCAGLNHWSACICGRSVLPWAWRRRGPTRDGHVEFVASMVLSELSHLLQRTTGSVFPNLSSDDIREFTVLIPGAALRMAFCKRVRPLRARLGKRPGKRLSCDHPRPPPAQADVRRTPREGRRTVGRGGGVSGAAKGELILYRTEDGRAAIQLRAVDGTVWLTQAEIAALFDTTQQNVTLHLRNLYAAGELDEAATCQGSLTGSPEGPRRVRRRVRAYNLDAILAVGYRVRSPRGSQFRRWATTVLRDYLIKGFALNDERLKEPGGLDYFDELLARIRDIRASEKRFYQKVRDLFKTSSVDYDGSDESAKTFFATIQNKLVFAVTGSTAAELIVARADAAKPNMALTTWQGARVRKADVTVSKNYLASEEIEALNRLTTMFLDFAEDRARRRLETRMADWIVQTDRFLVFNERDVLRHAGSVSHERMEQIAHQRFEAFDANRRAAEAIEAAREADEDIDRLEAEARRLKPPDKPR